MKKLILLFLVVVLVFSCTAVFASEKPVTFKDTITVTSDGGRFQIGFVNVEFKKDSLDSTMLPITFEVKVYADNGQGVIEFSPGVSKFYKKVHIRIDAYNGLLYDVSKGENVQVNFKNKQILADHFSRYCW